MSAVELWAYSIYGAETRKGLVKLLKDKEVIATVSPQEARSWAMNILEAAEAAETDEYLIWLLTQRVGLDLKPAAKVLQEFRDYREKRQGEPD
jgi:hypothetical protein